MNKIDFGTLNLSLSKNPVIAFDNTIGAKVESVETPIIYKDHVVGFISDVTE